MLTLIGGGALTAGVLAMLLIMTPCAFAMFAKIENVRAVMREVEPTNIGRG